MKKFGMTMLILIIALTIGGALTIVLLKKPPRWNVVLVSIDTLRAERLGCYGYDRPTTPNLDSFSRTCFRFTEAISQSPWTLPSHMSIFTSLYPSTHKVGRLNQTLDPGITTLAQVLKTGGYRTAGFVDARFMSAKYGFDRGFEIYRNSRGGGIRKALPPALAWLEENHRRPFFLFLHVFDCHCPYTPPQAISRRFSPDYRGSLDLRGKCGNPLLNRMELTPEDVEYISQQYDGEIRNVDTELQKLFNLLAELDLYRNTLVVVLSDHGEEFKEHGQIGHQRSVYDELMRIPLLIRLPGLAPEAREIRRRVQAIDVMPTVLDILGLKTEAPLQGDSLRPLLDSEWARWGDTAFGELNELAVKQTVYRDHYKYIYNADEGTEELYNLENDRREEVNLAEKEIETCGAKREILESLLLRAREAGEKFRPGQVTIAPRAREALKDLGYVE